MLLQRAQLLGGNEQKGYLRCATQCPSMALSDVLNGVQHPLPAAMHFKALLVIAFLLRTWASNLQF